jgi:hypothetical protein
LTRQSSLDGRRGMVAVPRGSTKVDNLEPLKGLIALRSLYLSETNVANVEPLKGLTTLIIYRIP